MSTTSTIARRLQALEAPRIQRHQGIVVVLPGETEAMAVSRVQPAGPFVVLPAKREPHHAHRP